MLCILSVSLWTFWEVKPVHFIFLFFFFPSWRRAVVPPVQTTGLSNSQSARSRKALLQVHLLQGQLRGRVKGWRVPVLQGHWHQQMLDLEKELRWQRQQASPSEIQSLEYSMYRFSCCRWVKLGAIALVRVCFRVTVCYYSLCVCVSGRPSHWWRFGFPAQFTDIQFSFPANSWPTGQHLAGSASRLNDYSNKCLGLGVCIRMGSSRVKHFGEGSK